MLTHPGPTGGARYPVIAILAFAMGIQNALMRRWGIRDLATNLFTLTYTGLFAEWRWRRRWLWRRFGGSRPRS